MTDPGRMYDYHEVRTWYLEIQDTEREFKALIDHLHTVLSTVTDEAKQIELQTQLVACQTQMASVREYALELKELMGTLLPRAEAIMVVRAAILRFELTPDLLSETNSRSYIHDGEAWLLYRTDSKYALERMMKAVNTLTDWKPTPEVDPDDPELILMGVYIPIDTWNEIQNIEPTKKKRSKAKSS